MLVRGYKRLWCLLQDQRGMLLLRQVSHNTRETIMGYDFDLCCNEQCPKRFDCQRYMTYKYSEWEHCYVMHGCIDYQLLKERIE